MTGLLGPDGKPISSISNKKNPAPALGERYGQWSGEVAPLFRMPGGGTIAFDTSTLTLADMRQMRGHYQINSSLSILTFMMHQMEWHIESEKQAVADMVENQLRNVWSRLVRAKSQALWAGFGPNILQWENDYTGREVVLTKIKDLMPEDARVHWKEVSSPVPGVPGQKYTTKVYDGITQWGGQRPVPVENSYWYPLLMENGNYYGRRLLEPAFQPWFFSILMHLFANRYYERFGEPTPVGRAPFDDGVEIEGQEIPGNQLMATLIQQLRNRSVVVLPNDRTVANDENDPKYDYTLEYLESQMRGADFERYMTRLDEEMSLAMFTPILMMRTADVGSYNLGTQHTQVYQWMLNAFSGDWADYINKYIIRPIVAYNFNGRPVKTKIVFTKMGKTSNELLQAIISQQLTSGKWDADPRQIGEMAGLSFKEIEQVTDTQDAPPPEQQVDPNAPDKKAAVKQLIIKRVRAQVEKGFKRGSFGSEEFVVHMGYKRQLAMAMKSEGIVKSGERVDDLFDQMNGWLYRTAAFGIEEYEKSENYMRLFQDKLDASVEHFSRGA